MSVMAIFTSYYDSMHNQSRVGFAATYVFLGLIVLFVPPLFTPTSVPRATGHFEEYCDGVGIFLAKVDGAPASGKLVFFSNMGFPGGTFGGEYIGQGKWSDVSVFADGCVPDGKCQSIAHGRVWINALDTPPKHISGRYEIKLNSKLLEGIFTAERHDRKHPLRPCM
jgi:hypothetical protein